MEALLILEQMVETEISPNKTKLDLEEFSLENLSEVWSWSLYDLCVIPAVPPPENK